MASTYNRSGPAATLLNCAKRLRLLRGTIAGYIDGSSKVERALDEIGSIEEYLREVVEVLLSPPDPAGSWKSLGFRLLGCSGLLTLAASDIKLRVRGHEVLRASVEEILGMQRTIDRLARELAFGCGDAAGYVDAIHATEQATKLARILEEWDARASKQKPVTG